MGALDLEYTEQPRHGVAVDHDYIRARNFAEDQ